MTMMRFLRLSAACRIGCQEPSGQWLVNTCAKGESLTWLDHKLSMKGRKSGLYSSATTLAQAVLVERD